MIDDRLLIETLAEDARRVGAIGEVQLGVVVPSLGTWTVADVVAHLGGVHRWATALAATPGVWFRRRELPPPPAGLAVLPWYREGVDPMLAEFSDVDLDVIVNTWAGERPRKWWLRRLCHETVMHRWDVDAAVHGTEDAVEIEPMVAVDGIDELFENFLPRVAQNFGGNGETLHLHATDATGEWQLTFEPQDVRVERSHAKADAAARGTAADLLLLLWHRTDRASTAAELFGDAAIVDHWHRTARF